MVEGQDLQDSVAENVEEGGRLKVVASCSPFCCVWRKNSGCCVDRAL
jgi:hypothetical protein